MKLTLLPSDKGDCLFLQSQDGTSILIDGGLAPSYIEHVRPFIDAWKQQHPERPLDLVYLSHIDQDHIGGVLQLMDDLAAWRVFNHKKSQGEAWPEPAFPEPPPIARLWHNGFHDLVDENAGEIGSMLAARAAVLTNSTNLRAQKLAAAYQAIAASIPESIKLSARVSPQQLRIPLNGEFGGLLALVRDPADVIRLGNGTPEIRVLGPFEEDLEKLRDKWDAWLLDEKNKENLRKTRRWRDQENEHFDFSFEVDFDIDDELGNRTKVTEENLASLMLLVTADGKRLLLTGDGHHEDIIHGLKHNGLLPDGQGLHVDVLKIPHHGSEHNFTREFAKRVTADHYVICGNGRHENPDLRVLDVLVESRLGTAEQRSSNPEVDRKFQVWFNCSAAFLDREVEKREEQGRPVKEYQQAAEHFRALEQRMRKYQNDSPGKLDLHFLDQPSALELTLA